MNGLLRVPPRAGAGIVLLTFFVSGAAAWAEEGPVALPAELLGHVVYYNGFESDDCAQKPEIDKFGVTADRRCPVVPGKGIRGAALQNAPVSHGHFSTKSPDLGMNHNRTFSFWFRYEEKEGAWHRTAFDHGGGPGMSIMGFGPQGACGMYVNGAVAKGLTLTNDIYGFPGVNRAAKGIDDFVGNWPPGEWHQAVISSNGKRLMWFMDGQKVFEHAVSKPLEPPFQFDQCIIGGNDAFVDEFVVFNAALTEDAVAEYYASMKNHLARKEMFK